MGAICRLILVLELDLFGGIVRFVLVAPLCAVLFDARTAVP